ncbi:MAG TPA: UDP-N-acetylmuramoyl-L-alanyl-D-glutamate--2,6-diaminopimelate ligase [Candidatus Methylomirabilis sp.]|nr:UDP-N-acetylmuramoyl-L-alanyl-D-glutamate--2,6-diaminopimelate ligase [Candidatus Methylomirabilis sp.]
MMRLSELLPEVPGAEVSGPTTLEFEGVAHDSRTVVPGSLFVCIQGFRQDGHAFIGDAASRGAVAVMVERDPQSLPIPPGLTVIRVPDSRAGLAAASARFFAHPSRSLRLVGVTGTNGKTTTASLVESILGAAGHPCGLLGTIEYRLGRVSFPGERTTPESSDLQRLLARMRDLGAWAASMEVSSHSLVLHRVGGCEFDVGIFTNLTQDHLDFHGTMERYADAKALLFRGLAANRTKPGEAAAVLNADDPWAPFMAQATTARVIRFGMASSAEVRVRERTLTLAGIRATAETPWGPLSIASPLVGQHNLSNILGAAAACLHLGLDPERVSAGIAGLTAVPGRFEKVEVGQPFGVVVDYAHTPDALERVLAFAREYATGRLIAVFGCGGDRDRTKRPRMGEAAARLADLVIVTSDNPRTEDPLTIIAEIDLGVKKACTDSEAHATIPDRREAIGAALARARAGDLVVIAGKGHETYQILGNRTIPFDDRVVAREVLAALGYTTQGTG